MESITRQKRIAMRPCYVVEIVTPKRFVLNGLWFGPKKPQQVIILIHGLTGSLFSMRRVVDELVARRTAVLTFNNRGFEHVSETKRKRGRESEWVVGGGGHEVFTDCADDVQGAVSFARRAGVRKIYLAGHSTGCQKAYYWAHKNKGGRGVKGIVLFGPLSDYAIAREQDKSGKLGRSVAYARKLVRSGRPHDLMPKHFGPWFTCDAQRFLSLYSGKGPEEIFTYWDPKRNPRTLGTISLPTLVLLAGDDEFADRPAKDIAAWFEKHLQKGRVVIIPGAKHSFRGDEKVVAHAIRKFIR